EKTSAMAARASNGGARVVAAVNADFFWLTTGENENNQVLEGEWWKGVRVTDSPYDTWDNAHVQLALDALRRPSMGRYAFDGVAIAHGARTPIITLNFFQPANPEGTTLYTSRYGATTPRDTSRAIVEASLISFGRHDDTLLFVRAGAVASAGGSAIPPGGAVLSAYGAGVRATEVKALTEGDTVRVVLATSPRVRPTLLIGGWPRLLADGKSVAGESAFIEGTISRNAEMKHPRTAIGYSRDGRTLYILAVDGRSTASVGLTLVELATVMRKLGAWNAMNFDGGGSTTMVIDGAVVNKPSDATGERAVGNALMVVVR
ncbi:MAG: phosphodiester glycosidase family protein, partial [Gemmatimonadaceae bacterium]